jgi:hypothetical protein
MPGGAQANLHNHTRVTKIVGYNIACTSPTFWALFLNAVQTEIPELCTTKLCRFYEAIPPSPASHELRICKMSVWCPCWPLLPLDRRVIDPTPHVATPPGNHLLIF